MQRDIDLNLTSTADAGCSRTAHVHDRSNEHGARRLHAPQTRHPAMPRMEFFRRSEWCFVNRLNSHQRADHTNTHHGGSCETSCRRDATKSANHSRGPCRREKVCMTPRRLCIVDVHQLGCCGRRLDLDRSTTLAMASLFINRSCTQYACVILPKTAYWQCAWFLVRS